MRGGQSNENEIKGMAETENREKVKQERRTPHLVLGKKVVVAEDGENEGVGEVGLQEVGEGGDDTHDGVCAEVII